MIEALILLPFAIAAVLLVAFSFGPILRQQKAWKAVQHIILPMEQFAQAMREFGLSAQRASIVMEDFSRDLGRFKLRG